MDAERRRRSPLRARVKSDRSGDGRSVDAIRAPAREMIVESWGGEYEMRRSGQRDRCCSEGVHAKQAATVTGGRFAVAIRIPVLGTAIMMAVACAVGVHVDAAVMVGRDDAMLVGQAVGGGRTIDEGERDRRRQNAHNA
jgi:hypothetical protein